MKGRPWHIDDAVIQPLAPLNDKGRPLHGWRFMEKSRLGGVDCAWGYDLASNGRWVFVISSIEGIHEPEHPEQNGPHYHISMSLRNPGPGRIPGASAAYLLKTCFGGLEGWEEDNHVPGGRVRNFWRPVDESKVGLECFCKQHEPTIVEDRGDFVWRPVST